MHRERNLIEKIADPDNLRLAFYKARRGKEAKMEVVRFTECLDENLYKLRNDILSGSLNIGNYHYFTIFDPKQRLICAAQFHERVLHHAIMNVCHSNFEKFQIKDSYASRLGKGTYAAIEQAKTNQKKYNWFLKLDVRKYFDSINHSLLKSMLERRFADDLLLKIFNDIIDSYSTKEDYGLPIGNLTSQYFANHYLAVADHYIKERLKAKAYVRYMDDMVIWNNDKKTLLEIGYVFQKLINTQLLLTLKPFCMNKVEAGLPFCGYTIYPQKILLTQNSRKRFISKIRLYDFYLKEGIWSQETYQAHITPLLAFTEHANSKGLRKFTNDTIN